MNSQQKNRNSEDDFFTNDFSVIMELLQIFSHFFREIYKEKITNFVISKLKWFQIAKKL